MRHTYLIKTMDWEAAGTYYDENGGKFKLSGVTKILRDGICCTLTGFMEVAFQKPAKFYNDYTFEFTDRETLPWESFNSALGVLKGRFVFIDDTIISAYSSEDGIYTGTEVLIMESPNRYKNTGVSFKNGVKLSSWTAVLTAIA